MFDRNSINGSVEWLGVTNLLRNDGTPWNLNLLAPYADWGDRRSSNSTNLGSGSGGYYDCVSINWNCPTHVLPIYHWMIFENTRSAACRACDDLLTDKFTYCMQNPSTCCNPICACLVNRQDNALDDCRSYGKLTL